MSKPKLVIEMIQEREPKLVCKLTWPKGQSAVAKIHIGNNQVEKHFIEREAVALEVLKNLAVPKRVKISRAQIKSLVGNNKSHYVAMESIPWKSCFDRSFTFSEALGIWAFAIEQMCAFHCKGILYPDLKASHLLVSNDLAYAKIIDFGGCLGVELSGKYPTFSLEQSPLFGAPEFFYFNVHRESLLTYQGGMLLCCLLYKKLTNPILQTQALRKIKEKILKNNLFDIYKIIEKCLSKDPSERPRNFETLLSEIQRLNLPEDSYKVWSRLRSPYQKELSKLGFKDPMLLDLRAA